MIQHRSIVASGVRQPNVELAKVHLLAVFVVAIFGIANYVPTQVSRDFLGH